MRRATRYGFALLLATASASAATPDDFAFGRAIDAPPGGSIYRLTLPEAVYRGVTRKDLGDLRVFNARGEAVPHALRLPPVAESAEPPARAVPLFPLTEAAAQQAAELQIRIDPQGARVDARPGPAAEESVAWYLLDLGDDPPPTATVELDFAGEDFAAQVAVDAGDDLAALQPVAVVSLARLRHGGALLEQDRIPLPRPVATRYLRLAWPQAARGARITAAQVRPPRPPELPARQWVAVEAAPLAGERPAYHFSNPGVMPLEQLRITPAEVNSVARVRVLSSEGQAEPIRLQATGLVYELLADGQRIASEPLDVAGSAPYWQLELLEGGFGSRPPRVELGWTPRQLLFTARGEGPFLLAWGAAGVGPSEVTLDPLLREREASSPLVREAALGEAVLLGGPERLAPVVVVRWRQLGLWGLLIAGVAGLGLLAWRLAREPTQ